MKSNQAREEGEGEFTQVVRAMFVCLFDNKNRKKRNEKRRESEVRFIA